MQRTCNSIVLILILGMASCGGEDRIYSVAGHQYCVPENYSVPDVPWVPDSPLYPDSGGFAFSACISATNQGCPFPQNVGGGTFGGASSVGNWKVESLVPKSHYEQILHDPLSTVEISTDDLAIISRSDTRNWLVVKLRGGQDVVADEPSEYEEILAVCENSIDYRGEGRSRRQYIRCARHVINDDLGLSYRFESDLRAPGNILETDSRIFSVIESWKCEE